MRHVQRELVSVAASVCDEDEVSEVSERSTSLSTPLWTAQCSHRLNTAVINQVSQKVTNHRAYADILKMFILTSRTKQKN